METQRKAFKLNAPKKELPKTMKELENRVLDGIKNADSIDVVIKWDEYTKKKGVKFEKLDFSDEFKKKVGELAAKKVNELENGGKN